MVSTCLNRLYAKEALKAWLTCIEPASGQKLDLYILDDDVLDTSGVPLDVHVVFVSTCRIELDWGRRLMEAWADKNARECQVVE
jgi:hypothetical protein